MQLAKADGFNAVADASESDEELVRTLGAEVVLRRGEEHPGLVRERWLDGVVALIGGVLTLRLAETADFSAPSATMSVDHFDGRRYRLVCPAWVLGSPAGVVPMGRGLRTLRHQWKSGVPLCQIPPLRSVRRQHVRRAPR